MTPHEFVLSLEVGEHLPPEYEETFIKNLIRNSVRGIVLSWAKPGQAGAGHVNLRTEAYIKQKFKTLGYINNIQAEARLRSAVTNCDWFKDTIMVFELPRKLNNKVTTQGRGNIKVTTTDRDEEPPVVIPLSLNGESKAQLILSRYEEPVGSALSVCLKYDIVLESCALLVTAAKETHAERFAMKRKYVPRIIDSKEEVEVNALRIAESTV
jgi:hypothetical protein